MTTSERAAEVRPHYGANWANPDAPLLPSERLDHELGRCGRARPDVLRRTLNTQVDQWLPVWSGRMTPHVLRHYCASSLYAAGMDLKALQELLGHQWLVTTSGYIHVRSDHIQRAWDQANERLEDRFGQRRLPHPGRDQHPAPARHGPDPRRAGLPEPAVALAVALVAFHGLTGKQVRELQLTDIVDGRLLLDGCDIPLAAPVRTRLTAWLDYRNQTWPASANPHLLINRRTAPRLVPSGPSFPWKESRIRPRALREDRILHEIHATGGDVRRIYDLFGLSVDGATRYMKTVEHPDLRNENQPGTLP